MNAEMGIRSFYAVILFLAACTSKGTDNFQDLTSLERSNTQGYQCHYVNTASDHGIVKGLTHKLMGYVDWGAPTYQRPSMVLSGWSSGEFVNFLLIPVTIAFFLRTTCMESLGKSQDLKVIFLLGLLLCTFPATKGEIASFEQTAPANAVICPGQEIVYCCTTAVTGVLEWRLPGQPSVVFEQNSDLNSIIPRGQFNFELISFVMDGLMLRSTAVSERANSSMDGLEIECNDGVSSLFLPVDVADGAPNCSNVSVVCAVIPSAMDKSEIDINIHVQYSANSQLMCAVEYLIQFNGENATVPVGFSSVNFTIDTRRQLHSLEGMIYTLDNESRIGQIPCSFSNPGNIFLEVKDCDVNHVLIEWTPFMITGCLKDDTSLGYRIQYVFGDNILFLITNDTFAKLSLGSEMRITNFGITPVIHVPDVQLLGTTSFLDLNEEIAHCLGNIPVLSTPTTASEGGDNSATDVGLAAGLTCIAILQLLLLLAALVIVCTVCWRMKVRRIGNQPEQPLRGKCPTTPDEEASSV